MLTGMRYSIQIDFDGTIIAQDINKAIQEKIPQHIMHPLLQKYNSGSITVEELNISAFQNCGLSLLDFHDVMNRDFIFREGFIPALDYFIDSSVDVSVVSYGFDFYVNEILQVRHDLELNVYCGNTLETPFGFDVEYRNAFGVVCTDGFKSSFVRKKQQQGYQVVYIGDGRSDYEAAISSDIVFARARLKELMIKKSKKFIDFVDFNSVISFMRKL
tara:strand:+ start:213 stop:860 length:648 start_codon:yes stop_codon:yes gene_type:complete